MFCFEKQLGKDFTVLNLTDIQMDDAQWDKPAPGYDSAYAVLDFTVRTLIDRVKPDLITVTGDIGNHGQYRAYPAFGRYLDGFGIPWCLVWGNHDWENGTEFVHKVLADYRAGCKNFFFEAGDASLGNGNYLITVCREKKPLHTLFMLDSHSRSYVTLGDGKRVRYNDRITPAQLAWYQKQVQWLQEQGCRHSSMLFHIPIYAYNAAWEAAFDASYDMTAISVAESHRGIGWNKGYETAFGVRYEEMPLGPYPLEDGVFEVIKASGMTQQILVGHDHINNFCIPYQGIKLVFSTHTGMGCYWHPDLNGGTVLAIDDSGAAAVRHEYVNVSHLLKK